MRSARGTATQVLSLTPKEASTMRAAEDDASSPAGSAWRIDPGGLLDPKPPYLAGAACTACLDQQCREQETQCADSAFCSGWLSEARAREGPLIAANELLRKLDDARWAFDHGEASDWPRLDALNRCAQDQCADACQLGRDFSCVGRFEWRASYPNKIELRWRMVNVFNPIEGQDGWRIRACASPGCSLWLLAEVVTMVGGFGTLEVNLGTQPEFSGLFELDGGPDYFPTELYWTRPFFDRTYFRYGVIPKSIIVQYADLAGWPVEDRAVPQLDAVDCSGWTAQGVIFEVWKVGKAGYTRCPTLRELTLNPNLEPCSVIYSNAASIADSTIMEYRWPGPAWAQASGNILLLMRDRQTGFPLSMIKMVASPGTNPVFLMFPASAKQFSELPDEAWTVPKVEE